MRYLDVAIFGCGKIAGGFDQSPESTALPLTHAGAYLRDGRFNLLACVDPDEQRRKRFMTTWGIPNGYATVAEFRQSNHRPDVVSICSPTEFHRETIEALVSIAPKLVFCEKPICAAMSDSEGVVELCHKTDTRIAVNYTRRWDPDAQLLRNRIESRYWGRLRTISGLYNKGILNNGSHMLDLLHMVLGPMKIIHIGAPVYDYFDHDPTIPVWLEGPRGVQVHLGAANAQDYAVFELHLVFENAIVSMEDGGLAWRERSVGESDIFRGYKVLNDGIRRLGAYPLSMLHAVDNIFRAVTNAEPLESSGETALLAHRACDSIAGRRSLKSY
jgi:predicted dehydrogenase